jgi:SMC interacting uncharacterized protein involved in chromosome segregation
MNEEDAICLQSQISRLILKVRSQDILISKMVDMLANSVELDKILFERIKQLQDAIDPV